MVMIIPQEKVDRAVSVLNEWLMRDRCTKSQTQSLLGHLNHLAAVIQAGRAFTSSIVDLLRADVFPADITDDLKADIAEWVVFLTTEFNRSCIIKSQDLAVPDAVFRIAVNAHACVIDYQGNISGYKLHSDTPQLPHRAMYAVAAWCIVNCFSDQVKGKVIKITVPSKVAALTINRAKTDCHIIRPLLRKFWIKMARNDCLIKAVPSNNSNYNELFHNTIKFGVVCLPK